MWVRLYRDVSTFLDFAHFENVEMYFFYIAQGPTM